MEHETRQSVISITISRPDTELNSVYFILFPIINIFLVTEIEIRACMVHSGDTWGIKLQERQRSKVKK